LKTEISYMELDMKRLISGEMYKFYQNQFAERERYRLELKQKEQELDKFMPQKYFQMQFNIDLALSSLITLKKMMSSITTGFRSLSRSLQKHKRKSLKAMSRF